MGQKSLSSLHRIDSSMIWNSYLYNNNFKWLSYNIWFSYIQFYKVIIFLNSKKIEKQNNFHYYDNTIFVKTKIKKYFHVKHQFVRFSYYIDLYCVEFLDYLLLINIFFLTDLKFYKNSHKKLFIHENNYLDMFI